MACYIPTNHTPRCSTLHYTSSHSTVQSLTRHCTILITFYSAISYKTLHYTSSPSTVQYLTRHQKTVLDCQDAGRYKQSGVGDKPEHVTDVPLAWLSLCGNCLPPYTSLLYHSLLPYSLFLPPFLPYFRLPHPLLEVRHKS